MGGRKREKSGLDKGRGDPHFARCIQEVSENRESVSGLQQGNKKPKLSSTFEMSVHGPRPRIKIKDGRNA